MKSLVIAVGIVAISVGWLLWFPNSRQFPWALFMAVIWVPLWGVIALQGGPHGAGGEWWSTPLIAFLAVLMWWGLIAGIRRLWRRLRILAESA